ncbi:MAG TPA: hypothetical protein VGQ57_03210 [Polyangiaceae bacterium]|jgi:hypothetical protein|nr:hypothetical protein [Polyangiaceae bacterium]
MNSIFNSISVFRPQPPPLWYVSNGELTVGPVATGLLMRGVEAGRVPDYCQVRASRGTWRSLLGVREISQMNTKPGMKPSPNVELEDWSDRISNLRDDDELCHSVTWLSLMATGAESAMLHFRSRSRHSRALVTRSVLGPMPMDRLGNPLPEEDFVLRSARLGLPVVGPPYGRAEDALAMRFAHSSGGVGAAAMIPIFAGGELAAMLEVARPGHAFRRSDLLRAERIVQGALRERSN